MKFLFIKYIPMIALFGNCFAVESSSETVPNTEDLNQTTGEQPPEKKEEGLQYAYKLGVEQQLGFQKMKEGAALMKKKNEDITNNLRNLGVEWIEIHGKKYLCRLDQPKSN